MRRSLAALVLLIAFATSATADVGPTTSTTSSSSTTSTTDSTTSTTTTTTASTLPSLTTVPSPSTTTPSSSTTSSTSSTTTSTSSSTTTTTTPGGSSGVESDGSEPSGPEVLPPGAQAIIDSVHRTAPNSSSALLAALQPLVDAGMPQAQAIQLGFGEFPVGGLANFSDDWLEPRFSGGFHFHHGTDVFAAGGLPVRAPVDGVLRQSSDPLGGNAAYVTQADGTFFYMAHVAGFVAGQKSGQTVHAGDVVAYVGNTGDAAGGPTHVHFEVHPKGGAPVDPKPYLDGWITDAIAAVPVLLNAVLGPASAPAGASSMGATTADRLALSSSSDGEVFAGPAVPARSQLLWASSASPAGGALQLASAEATEAAESVDWTAESRRHAAAVAAWDQSVRAAKAETTPLVPRPLRAILGLSP